MSEFIKLLPAFREMPINWFKEWQKSGRNKEYLKTATLRERVSETFNTAWRYSKL